MMMPGRAVRMIRRSLLPGRSTSTDETPAAFSFLAQLSLELHVFDEQLVIAALTNQRDFHGLLMPRRNPYGWTFCPIYFPFNLCSLRRLSRQAIPVSKPLNYSVIP